MAPTDRMTTAASGRDQRHEYARDRDRVLYCSSFRRLAGVTQVVSAAEGHIFHNRLTHSLKVAQVARRLAEMLIEKDRTRAEALVIHPEVVEAAALSHDLGHPPFGHVGESALNECMSQHGQSSHGSSGGYEGNAQTFRIVAKLAMRREDQPGLNLTRATLNAILKYPWTRTAEGNHSSKWGAYESEADALSFARDGQVSDQQCAGAFIMDWADDITYSVHDVEDFYRSGAVPLDRLSVDEDERRRFLSSQCEGLLNADQILDGLLGLITTPLRRPFEGTQDQRGALRGFVSTLVERFVLSMSFSGSCDPPGVEVQPEHRREVDVLKCIMRYYVFAHPALASQQFGQKRVLCSVFEILFNLLSKKQALKSIPRDSDVLPLSLRECRQDTDTPAQLARHVCDAIASMTEAQLLALHGRLTGVVPGSFLTKIV